MDLTRYKDDTLQKMLSKAETTYTELTLKPIGNWGDGMRLSKLPSIVKWDRAQQRVRDIKKEIARRKEEANHG